MKSSYRPEDVTLLLKDITGLVTPLPTEIREQQIQRGVHYCEMLPLEYQPSTTYLAAYELALENYAKPTALAVGTVAEKIYMQKKGKVVLVSLARAGIPIGILIKHYLEKKYAITVPHYAISIIRGRGIDTNAMAYLLAQYPGKTLQFVDGWIGKGAIQRQLTQALLSYPTVSDRLAVVSDPANLSDFCGTHEDILIPSSCLNATVSGLISRTFLRNDIIGKTDFHGAMYYQKWEKDDVSYDFLHAIETHFEFKTDRHLTPVSTHGMEEVHGISQAFGIHNINFIKPGIGETTRVLLRRIPWKILVNPSAKNDPVLRHLFALAREKKVPIEYYPMHNYKACGLIKQLSDV